MLMSFLLKNSCMTYPSPLPSYLLLHMGSQKLVLASLFMSICLHPFVHSYSQAVFPPLPGSDAPSSDGEAPAPSPAMPELVFDVDDYGAKADGTDDTKAFRLAWEDACSNSLQPSVLLVPQGKTYLLMPINFSGPCRAPRITVMIRGTIEAPSNRSVWLQHNYQEWIGFRRVEHLHVLGGGTLNGNGHEWWMNSCKTNGSLALHFRECTYLRVEELTVRDAMQMHVVFAYSRAVQASNLVVTAPEWSPNTDGIHVSNSKMVTISDCFIGTGDDCISIVSGSRDVKATGIFCGPGHGISIGSLGAGNRRARVSNVIVEKSVLVGTTNGVRIKTWQGGSGYAKRITFQDIYMRNVANPIIIDQNYCDSKIPCHEQESAVAINMVYYGNIQGTSASEVAINLNCSSAIHCNNVVMQDIFLAGEATEVTAKCNNVKLVTLGDVFPPCTGDEQGCLPRATLLQPIIKYVNAGR